MKAVQVVRHGPPAEVVEVNEVPVPEPGAGEVRIAVAAASLNFGDIARARGGVASVMGEPPFTLGMDVAGVVDAAGDGMTDWIGRRVVGMTNQSLGGMAEYALSGAVFDAPPELDDVEAAAFTLPFHLGYLALHGRAALRAGETVLVRGGASAVGTAAIQLAVAAGARVIAMAGGPEKLALCRELGAEAAIDHTADGDLLDQVMEHTHGRGADLIYDPIGGELTETLWTCGTVGARYIPVGFNDDPQSGLTGRPLRKVSMANISVIGVILGYREPSVDFRRFGLVAFPPETGQRVHTALCELVSAGSIRPTIGRRIGFDEVGATLDAHDRRLTSGRSVLVVDPGGST